MNSACGERRGVGGVLDMSPLADLAADVDRERREAEQHDEEQRDHHEDLPALGAHQFTTMVTVAPCVKRELLPRIWPMNGTTMLER